MKQKVKTKYRVEYMLDGYKHVRTFGSEKQAKNYIRGLAGKPQEVEIRSYQEKEDVQGR